jgi:hypothetical protein
MCRITSSTYAGWAPRSASPGAECINFRACYAAGGQRSVNAVTIVPSWLVNIKLASLGSLPAAAEARDHHSTPQLAISEATPPVIAPACGAVPHVSTSISRILPMPRVPNVQLDWPRALLSTTACLREVPVSLCKQQR